MVGSRERLVVTGRYRSQNHNRGGSRRIPFSNNPSLKTTFEATPVGVHILHGDGHDAWVGYDNDLVWVFKPGPTLPR